MIAVGNNAHLALKGAALTAYYSLSNFKRPGYIGFPSTGKTAYTDALAAPLAANHGGSCSLESRLKNLLQPGFFFDTSDERF